MSANELADDPIKGPVFRVLVMDDSNTIRRSA